MEIQSWSLDHIVEPTIKAYSMKFALTDVGKISEHLDMDSHAFQVRQQQAESTNQVMS